MANGPGAERARERVAPGTPKPWRGNNIHRPEAVSSGGPAHGPPWTSARIPVRTSRGTPFHAADKLPRPFLAVVDQVAGQERLGRYLGPRGEAMEAGPLLLGDRPPERIPSVRRYRDVQHGEGIERRRGEKP